MSEETIDDGKYTQRELLILLNSKVSAMDKKMEKLSDDYVSLHVRVSNIETRTKIIAAAWGIGSVVISLIINVIKLFING